MNQEQETPALSPLIALAVLLGVIVVLVLFVGLAVLLEVSELWASFLFLLYWGGIHKLAMVEYAHSAVGSLFGLLLIYLAHHLGELVGVPEYGLPLFLALICVVVYLQILGRFHVFINLAAMLYLTVGTIPQLAEIPLFDIGKAVLLSIVYFGTLGWLGAALARKKQASTAH